MTPSPSFVSHNQAVWARAAGTDWVKSAVDITSCTVHAQTNYSYSFWQHYSSEYEYTIRYRSEYEANIRNLPSNNDDDIYSASHMREFTVVHLGQSLLAPGGRQLVRQTENLIFESACRLLLAEHSPIATGIITQP